jgi:hypothetical protein
MSCLEQHLYRYRIDMHSVSDQFGPNSRVREYRAGTPGWRWKVAHRVETCVCVAAPTWIAWRDTS